MPSPGEYVAATLTQEERIRIYQWVGEGYTQREVCDMFNKSRNIVGRRKILRIDGLTRVLGTPEAHRAVSKFRVEFLKSVKNIPISQKVVRLDDLEKIRQSLMFILTSCRPEQNAREFSKLNIVTRRIIEIMEIARSEMENRSGIAINITPQGELSELSDEQLKAARDELLRKARIAFKQRASGVDELSEGDEAPYPGGSPEVLLAPSEELRRDKVPPRDYNFPDVRQQEDGDKGMPAV
jgi:hypothetical protein